MSVNTNLFIYINNNLQNPFLDAVMPAITDLGGFVFLLLIVIIVILYAKISKRETLKKVAIVALIALLFSDVITLLLKHIIQEPRPFMALDNVRLLIVEDDPCSFPSGHASSVFAVVSVFIFNMEKLVRKYHLAISAVLLVFAIAILFSRVYCGVHYPDDVAAGAIIGIFGALIVNRFKEKIFGILRL
nr:phosphatase PAP2 family protein [uncultured Methanobrevibacter sp.]